MGGSSLEMARVADCNVLAGKSLPYGVFAITAGEQDGLAPEIATKLEKTAGQIGGKGQPLYLVGGSWRNLARVDMALREYPLRILHAYRMSPARVTELVEYVASRQPADLAALPGVSKKRAASLKSASQLLAILSDLFNPPYVEISSYGLREGLVYQQLRRDSVALEPTIAGFRAMARRAGADPTFRAALAEELEDLAPLWLPPEWGERAEAFSECAACLAEIAARQQPDYRAQSAFLLALATTAIGLTHEERLFFAFAAARRHHRRIVDDHADLARLLKPENLKRALILGALVRFICEASGRAPDSIPELRASVADNALEVAGEHELGELTRKRLGQLRDELA
jgi:exopolyphosphatase/guanosine-5'-triphosphate,3'-diphosphate pyrophosphatase